MPAITAKLVMELRDATNLPMMKCKQALEANDGDKTAAIEWLRKQGIAAAGGKFADRETPNGSCAMALAADAGVIVQLGCQTDFVGGNDAFKAFAKELVDLALATKADSVEALKAHKLGDLSIDDAIAGKIAQMGEKIVLVKVLRLVGPQVTGYNHGGKIATLVSGTGDVLKIRQVALHVASASPSPIALSKDQVDAAVVAKEREILMATPDVQAKPEAMRGKIVEGKLGRFFKENVLLDQEMLLDAEKGETVEAYAKRTGITITGFVRTAV
jgi:elongation factor Ts